ncbi:MAG: helix-turn-helix domain-containing protein [Candidatus Hodarchaeales archaeon]
MSDISKQLARKIKDARKARGLTQQDLAEQLGRTAAAVSDLERGKVQVSAVDLKILADFLEKPIEYFYGEDFGGRDVEDLVALIRGMDPRTRDKLLPTTQAMANMLEISAAIENTDPQNEEALVELADNFYSTLKPFLENVGQLYNQGRELQSKLSKLLPEN